MKFLVSEKDDGIRLDIFLSKKIDHLTRSNIKKIINSNCVKINKKIANSSSKKVKLNDIIEIKFLIKNSDKLLPNKIKLNIYFEDKDILIINKPKGMVVHPGAGNYQNTLANALVYKYKDKLSNINGELRPGIVHRLDAETSGVMLIAKNNDAHLSLAKQFKDRTINKKYMSITWGKWVHEYGEIEGWISRKKSDPTTFIFNNKLNIGKYSKTKYVVEKQYVNFAKVLFYPLTGRTHQIRVHSSFCGNPIFGDKKYGGGQKKSKQYKPEINKFFANQLASFGRFALHAYSIDFNLINKDEKRIKIEAPIPKEFVDLENTLLNYES